MVVGVALAVVLSGCGAVADEPPTPSGASASTSSSVPVPASDEPATTTATTALGPVASVEAVKGGAEAVIAATTGRWHSTLRLTTGSVTSTTTIDGVFDLGAALARADSVEEGASGTVVSATIVDGRQGLAYVQSPRIATPADRPWVRISPEQARTELGIDVPGGSRDEPPTPMVLFLLGASAAEPADGGFLATVPAGAVTDVIAPGAVESFIERGVTPSELTAALPGDVEIEVRLDAAGRLVWGRVDLGEVVAGLQALSGTGTPGAPVEAWYEEELAGLGEPVAVTVPSEPEVVDASEVLGD